MAATRQAAAILIINASPEIAAKKLDSAGKGKGVWPAGQTGRLLAVFSGRVGAEATGG
ncbi:MAG: hypothetical protein ABL956_11850 [Hyphomonadaceae bacterium]